MAPDVELRGTVDRIDRGPDGLIVLDYKLGKESTTIRDLYRMFAPPRRLEELAGWRPSDLQLPLYVLAVERGVLDVPGFEAGERVTEVGLIYPLDLYTQAGRPSEKGRRTIRIVDHTSDCGSCGEAAASSGT